MKILYLDTAAGISGDMTVGALLDAGRSRGLTIEGLRGALTTLSLDGFEIGLADVKVGSVRASSFSVSETEHQHYHRDWATIRRMIEEAGGRGLPGGAVERALAIFGRLAEAEAEVHDAPLDKVHFHEVGAIDSIVDIVGAAWCLDALGIEQVFVGQIPSGSGFVETQHGRLAVPAPATALLLRGFDVRMGDGEGELVTPTGAAILAATAISARPGFVIEAIGAGAGTKRWTDRPNLLRAFVGDAEDDAPDQVVILEADIDDMTPEALAHAAELLREAGARDVSLLPLTMKKNRSGFRLTVLAALAATEALRTAMLEHTTTLGVRYRAAHRDVLTRRIEVVETSYGQIAIKIGVRPSGRETAEPEFEDVARAAREHGATLADVRAAALVALKG